MIELFRSLDGDPSLIVNGVLLVCAIGGGLIFAKVVKRLRKRPKTPKYCDVYAPRQWRTEGGWGGSNSALPPFRKSEGPPKSCQTQPDCENC